MKQNKTSLLASVIIPVYNVEKYLERCVRSILEQTYDNIEVVLINDGSTDDSLKVCHHFANEDSRIRVYDQVNSGSSIARNKGLKHAKGDIIAFVDSDDHIAIDFLEQMISFMIKYDLDVVEIERDDISKAKVFDNSFRLENRIDSKQRIIANSSFQVWKRIYRRELLSDMSFIPKIIHQDVFFTLDLIDKIDVIGYLNSPLYYYNRESDSVIRSRYSLKKINTAIRATNYIKKSLGESPELDKVIYQYVVNYYTDHFFLLSRNKNLDKDRNYRSDLKQQVLMASANAKIGLRTWCMINFPIWSMEIIVPNYHRIKIIIGI